MKMIIPFGPSHRNDGCCFYLPKAINAMYGYSMVQKTMLEPRESWGEYDATVYVDWAQDCFPKLPVLTPDPLKPSLCWQSDTHWTDEGLAYRMTQSLIYRQPTFCQQRAVDIFNETPHLYRDAVWIPHAVDHTIYRPPMMATEVTSGDVYDDPALALTQPGFVERVPHFDLCFVGHVGDPGRVELLDTILAAFPNFQLGFGKFFGEARQIFHESALVFNQGVRGELNMRTFEAMGSRSFLLTDRQHGMDELGLKDGVHCAMYSSPKEAIEKGKYYLAHDDLRRQIAHAGWRWTLENHTYFHRAKRIIDLLLN